MCTQCQPWQTEQHLALQLVSDCILLALKDEQDPTAEVRSRLRKMVRVEAALSAASTAEFERRAQRALSAVGRMVSGKPAAQRALLRMIARPFSGLADALRPVYEDQLNIAYGIGRDGTAADLGEAVNFNTIDGQAKGWLTDHHLYWVGQAYDSEFSGRIAKIVDDEVIAQGLSYAEAAQVLKDKIGPELTGDKPLHYWEIVSSAAATRSRAFGAVESFVQAGVVEVEILNPEDEDTCETCNYLSGKVFTIQQAVSQRDAMMAAATPEDAKAVAPWVKPAEVVGLATVDLAKAGVTLPPYHGRCRCTANAVVVGATQYRASSSPPVEGQPTGGAS